MLFAVGTRVKLRSTGDEGVITDVLGNGLIAVYLEEADMEIPTYEDNLEAVEPKFTQKPSIKAKIVPGKQPKPPEPSSIPPNETQYQHLKSAGILLAFDRVDNTDAFAMQLINDTKSDIIFTFLLKLNGVAKQKVNNKLAANTVFKTGLLSYNELNDTPVITIECWRITTQGTSGKLTQELKIKPKQFFKKEKTAPLLNRKVHLYTVFDKLDASTNQQQTESEEDLRLYTQRNVRPPKSRHLRRYDQYNSHEFASFESEIDLHIEKLIDDFENMSNAEIIQLQLRHFDDFIDKAVSLGVDQVFVIHGLGKGRLRDEIASKLIQHPYVKTFKNEYHPRYGWGATEVLF